MSGLFFLISSKYFFSSAVISPLTNLSAASINNTSSIRLTIYIVQKTISLISPGIYISGSWHYRHSYNQSLGQSGASVFSEHNKHPAGFYRVHQSLSWLVPL